MNMNYSEPWEKKLTRIKGNISEVFASIQGEGLFVGTMQLFIRFDDKPADERTFVLRTLPGAKNQYARNPVSAERLFQLLSDTYPLKDFFCISFIGSEPLHQPEFLEDMLQILKKNCLATFVQTAGAPIKSYLKLSGLVDHWCIDLNCGTARNTLRCSRTLEKIIEASTPENTYFRLAIDVNDDPEKLLGMITGLQPEEYTLILQPCALFPAHISDWDTGTIISWIQLFQPHFHQVRWIPQVHKLLRIL